LEQANTLLNFRRPDLAFVEYLHASEIVINLIPRHKDYTHFTLDHPENAKKLHLLQKKISAQNDQFANIKGIIVSNNNRSGVRPQESQNGHIRSESVPTAQSHTSDIPTSGQASGPQAPGQRIKPTPSPKPESLHSRAISHATPSGANGQTSSDVLNDRFARLRMLDTSQRPPSRESNASSPLSRTTSLVSSSGKPQGPRGMPNGNGTIMPPLAIPNLPQAPPTAYSPARNMETTGNIAPPRHSARSLAGPTRRSSMALTSSASSHAPNGPLENGDYFPNQAANGRPNGTGPRRTSVNVPIETEITPEKLFDYLQYFSVLLIDFRSREEFDRGHILATTIMCVDPLSVRSGMSAEQLENALVISPEEEQGMFHQRDQYNFVVYYDASTQSESSLSHPVGQAQTGLNYLREALYDFNQEKPLRRPPMLLKGGLEAWTDMMGVQALLTSDTTTRAKQGRPVARRPVAGQLRVSKRRIRDYEPFNPEEEQFWREKARVESVALSQPPELSEDGVRETVKDGDEEDAEPSTAIREFLERFPDAGNLDPQAFARQKPTRAPPQVPAKIPLYPSAPAPSQFPSVPARPAPAAPRMSYQGVSDRQASGSQPSARSTSSQLTPYIPPRLLSTNLRLPRTGLVNFRNTCYMNSTIQALSATTPLSVLFLDDGFRSQVQAENWKGSHGHMTNIYANLIRNLWKGDVEVVKPSTFRSLVRRLASQFDNEEQQDAKEFFDVVIDTLHEDLNVNWARTPLQALTEQEEAKRERMPKVYASKIEWSRYNHRELSFIYNLFAGQHASKLTCLECNFTSTTYEAFTSISVEIPLDARFWRNGRYPTLDDCLRSYCSEEMLTRDDQWRCPRCKTFREAKKRLTLTRAPQFLVVHFKRFASQGRQSRKIRIPVDFPLNDFSLDPYMLPQLTPEDARKVADLYGEDAPKTGPEMTPPYTYDAYAVVRHIGATMQSGHYITAAKDQGRRCWHMFDDSRVNDFQPEQLRGADALQNEQAYIVFYQRRQ
ncbi:hypothetical protein BAUCODRAFT_45097, partial [Baudoinia panamericana UAMH 10762]